jgi:phosphoribosyl 1,2-cyclic phosphate phosphodiesterase
MRDLGEERLRTALLIRTRETLLVDCGPDIRVQLMRNRIERIDAILITHGHGDHYLGLDELEALRRSRARVDWKPMPVFASEKTWEVIERRFGYLIGKLLDKHIASAGAPLEALKTRVTPFETFHSQTAQGSVGYVFEENTETGQRKLVYTSDLMDVVSNEELLRAADVLIIESNFFNEPADNRPGHMSFQRALEFIERWKPKSETFLVHISDGDPIPGDSANSYLKKLKPANILGNPRTGVPYQIPTCQKAWQERVNQALADRGLPWKVTVAHDDLKTSLW